MDEKRVEQMAELTNEVLDLLEEACVDNSEVIHLAAILIDNCIRSYPLGREAGLKAGLRLLNESLTQIGLVDSQPEGPQ